MKKLMLALALLACAGLVLAACGAPPTASPTSTPELAAPIAGGEGEPRTIRLPMGFIPNVQYAPYYVAAERGYFAEAGIEIEFDYSQETDGVSLVGAGEVPFALASGEQVLLAREQGLPVVYVMAWWQDFPIGIAVPEDAGVESLQDLRGMDIGIPGLFGASYIGYQALASQAGLPADEAQLQSIGFNQVEALATGQVQAVVVYVNNEPIQLEAQGVPVRVIRVSEYVELASNGLVTNEQTIEDEPELVAGMTEAILAGLEDTIADPEAAYEISTRYVEGLADADRSVQMQVLRTSIEFWQADQLGAIDVESWHNMHDLLLEMELLSEPLDVEAAIDERFVR